MMCGECVRMFYPVADETSITTSPEKGKFLFKDLTWQLFLFQVGKAFLKLF